MSEQDPDLELDTGDDPGPLDDGAIEVQLDEAELPESLIYSEDDGNLVVAFESHPLGVAALDRIAKEVLESWDSGLESRKEYIDRMAMDWRIFACDLPKKDWPHEYAANGHVPIMIENVTRLAFRMYGEIFDDWNNVFQVQPLGPADSVVADILSKHSNWQIRVQIPDFKRQMHRADLAFFINGDITIHSYYDESNKRNAHELLLPDEFVVPFTYTSTMPDYSDCPWRAKCLTKYRHDLERMRGSWENIDRVIGGDKPSFDDDPERRLVQIVNDVQGINADEVDDSAPYKIIWFEGWLDLPNQSGLRFCQAIVDYRSRAVLKLAVHERARWQDQIRYDRQKLEGEQFHQALMQHQQMAQAHQKMLGDTIHAAMQAHQSGLMTPGMQQTAAQVLEQQSMAPLPPPPQPPQWMSSPDGMVIGEDGVPVPEQPKSPEKEPIHLFAHGVCIEPLVGNLGLGYGRVQADYNRMANTALAQFTDAATLGNVKSWVAADNVQFEGKFRISPGHVNRVKGIDPSDLKNALIPLETDAANPQMLELVDRAQQYGQSSMQAPSVLSGDPGKSGETFRGISARIEQATKQLSVVGYKFLECINQVLVNNAYLNSVFLPEEELYEISNALQSTVEPVVVRRDMYARSYAVEFRADMRFASQAQRIQEADEVYMMLLKDPATGPNPMNPNGNAALHYYTLKKCLEARGRRDLVQLLGAPPPPQPTFIPPAPPMPPPGMAPPGAGGPPGGAPPPQGPPGPAPQ